jgi:hypothetical protein
LLLIVAESWDSFPMPTATIVTSVYLSKAEALDVLSQSLDAPWITDDPSDVTLALAEGVRISIEVPKFGEDLPLTLDCHHDQGDVLERVIAQVMNTLEESLGWQLHRIG